MLFASSKCLSTLHTVVFMTQPFEEEKKSQSHKDKAKMKNAMPHAHAFTVILSKFEPNIIERGDSEKRKRKEQMKRTNRAEEWADNNNKKKQRKQKKQYLMGNQSEMYDRLINNIM